VNFLSVISNPTILTEIGWNQYGEYAYHHPYLDKKNLSEWGIWEENNQLVGVAHYEWQLGEAYFQFHPEYRHLRNEMLAHAEEHFPSITADSKHVLNVFTSEYDSPLKQLLEEKGYQRRPEEDRPLYHLPIPKPFPHVPVPDGITIKTLADEPDYEKVHLVLWHGFNHEGEPQITPEILEERRNMFETPKARMDIKMIAGSESGDFVSICGMFYDETNHYALVEPVATHPDYRRKGIGRATVMEGIHRCTELGATVAYVGSDQLFYQSMGFKPCNNSECWVKIF
jgi:predicted N-acetyltransferase YhbS